jgi:selenide,water dikinase
MADDAGVYLVDRDKALVQTVDFFPPVVDDPFDFGRVAAANALSDIYAMGATPLTALNIAAFPEGKLDNRIFADILRGGAHVADQAGVAIIGGHTVKDAEIKYGLAVTGFVNPSHMVTNAGARTGDVLVLTKPIGSGILTTALRAGKLPPGEISRLVDIMVQLNDAASAGMLEAGASACTDITGFGLLGHSLEMAQASGVTVEIEAGRIPVMEGALAYAAQGMLTGGGKANSVFLRDSVSLPDSLDEHLSSLLFDPQTSGGLLIALPERTAQRLVKSLARHAPCSAIIGRVVPKQSRDVVVL